VKLTDKEREAINDLPSWPDDIGAGSYRIAMDVLDRCLARDADGDAPADAAWMDGEECRELGFASTQAGCWGLCRPGGTINVCCHADVSSVELVDADLDGFTVHDPARRQIRAAVELVGRRAT
jgi:hypothetical protein